MFVILHVVLRTVKTSDSSDLDKIMNIESNEDDSCADKHSIKSDPGLSSWPGPRCTARIVVLLEQ